MQNSIELKEVGKSFYKNKILSFRLKNINLKASESQLIVLKGPNGSGKTTLLKLAKKLSLPDDGEIILSPEISEKDISFQASNENTFFPRLTVRENLEFFLGMKGFALEEDMSYAIPEELGECNLIIIGDPETTFTVFEGS